MEREPDLFVINFARVLLLIFIIFNVWSGIYAKKEEKKLQDQYDSQIEEIKEEYKDDLNQQNLQISGNKVISACTGLIIIIVISSLLDIISAFISLPFTNDWFAPYRRYIWNDKLAITEAVFFIASIAFNISSAISYIQHLKLIEIEFSNFISSFQNFI